MPTLVRLIKVLMVVLVFNLVQVQVAHIMEVAVVVPVEQVVMDLHLKEEMEEVELPHLLL
jgi:hypothetical protein